MSDQGAGIVLDPRDGADRLRFSSVTDNPFGDV
jgi:hypothetical protein